MSDKPANPPAFPSRYDPDSYMGSKISGMSLRDWFAGQALAGDMASQNETTGEWPTTALDEHLLGRAAFFYRYADAMLAARGEA